LLSDINLAISLSILAIMQLLVQCICFLRLNTSKTGRWNVLPFLFTIFIIAIFIGGSLWIMVNLNYNMVH
jgi:cytochrome o ubiquinol oxidase operon protein cyoD